MQWVHQRQAPPSSIPKAVILTSWEDYWPSTHGPTRTFQQVNSGWFPLYPWSHWWLQQNWLEMVSTSQKWCSQAYQKPYHQTRDWHQWDGDRWSQNPIAWLAMIASSPSSRLLRTWMANYNCGVGHVTWSPCSSHCSMCPPQTKRCPCH